MKNVLMSTYAEPKPTVEWLHPVCVNAGADVAAPAHCPEAVPGGVCVDDAARLSVGRHGAVVGVGAVLPPTAGCRVHPLLPLDAGGLLHSRRV